MKKNPSGWLQNLLVLLCAIEIGAPRFLPKEFNHSQEKKEATLFTLSTPKENSTNVSEIPIAKAFWSYSGLILHYRATVEKCAAAI